MIAIIEGYEVLLDDSDYDRVVTRKWYKNKSKEDHGLFYLDTSIKNENGKWKNVSLQRFIMNCTDGKNVCVDHINGNTLDNRKQNLRVCSRTDNTRNMKLSKRNTTGYKGVAFYKRDSRWVARITVNRNRIHIGYYITPEEAAIAYDENAIRYFGEFARLNFPVKRCAECRK